MKKGIFVFTLALGASCHVLAGTAESCPSVTAIEKKWGHVHGND
ncbi:hypothetical protein [Paraburkholderia youngii]